jgi:hypothetical protein
MAQGNPQVTATASGPLGCHLQGARNGPAGGKTTREVLRRPDLAPGLLRACARRGEGWGSFIQRGAGPPGAGGQKANRRGRRPFAQNRFRKFTGLAFGFFPRILGGFSSRRPYGELGALASLAHRFTSAHAHNSRRLKGDLSLLGSCAHAWAIAAT